MSLKKDKSEDIVLTEIDLYKKEIATLQQSLYCCYDKIISLRKTVETKDKEIERLKGG